MVILIDSREQKPLRFVTESITRKLDTGDYSLDNFEDRLCIERKGSLSEFYGNLTTKRFWNELERMKSIPFRYLILEFPLSDVDNFPHSLGLSKKIWSKMKVSPKYIHSCIKKIQFDYKVITLFVNNRTKSAHIIYDIMQRFYESQ